LPVNPKLNSSRESAEKEAKLPRQKEPSEQYSGQFVSQLILYIRDEEVKYSILSRVSVARLINQIKTIWLPNSDLLISALNKILVALQDTVQMEAIRSKWEEIKKLRPAYA
jgi:hypothetical protein